MAWSELVRVSVEFSESEKNLGCIFTDYENIKKIRMSCEFCFQWAIYRDLINTVKRFPSRCGQL